MSEVIFQYEITDRVGITVYSCWKSITMDHAPTQDLVFSDNDFTWQANQSIIYNFNDKSYFVRTVNSFPVEPIENYATMFEKMGWEVNS